MEPKHLAPSHKSAQRGRNSGRKVTLRGLWRGFLVALIVGVYLLAAPFGYGAFLILHLLPSKDPNRRARALQAIMRNAFALMLHALRVLRLVDFRPSSLKGKIPASPPCVIISNHPSLVDVAAVLSSIKNVTTAVRTDLYNKWWLRPLMHGAAFFEGARPGPLGAATVVEDAVANIRRGFHVVIFPEGTRSLGGELHPFGRTAFEIACRARVPVIPIVVHFDPPWLTKEIGMFQPPKKTPHMRMEVLEPVDPVARGLSSRQLRDVLQDRLRSELARGGPK